MTSRVSGCSASWSESKQATMRAQRAPEPSSSGMNVYSVSTHQPSTLRPKKSCSGVNAQLALRSVARVENGADRSSSNLPASGPQAATARTNVAVMTRVVPTMYGLLPP